MGAIDRVFPAVLLVFALAGCGGGGGSGGKSSDPGGDDGSGGSPGPDPAPELTWYLGFDGIATAGSEVRSPGDITSFQPETGATALFTRIDVAPSGLDAFERVSDSSYYFSLRNHGVVEGTAVAPGDVVQYLSGTYALAFNARDAGLPAGVNVDAVAVASNGDLVISTDIHFASGGNTFSDSDLVRVNDTGFTLFTSASDFGLGDAADISGVSIEGDDSKIYLSVSGHGTANGITFSPDDILSADSGTGISGIALDVGATVADGTPLGILSINR